VVGCFLVFSLYKYTYLKVCHAAQMQYNEAAVVSTFVGSR
jgi:hypothetical protein